MRLQETEKKLKAEQENIGGEKGKKGRNRNGKKDKAH